jgi:hypothetical protein
MSSPNTNPDQIGLSLSNGNRTETADQRFIRLLSILAKADEPMSSDETWLLVDIRALAELAAGGFISAGDVVRDECGKPCAICCVEITPSGRAYLAELQHEAESRTSIGFIKEHRFSFYKWFFWIVAAVVGTVIGGYILWRLTH